MLEENAWTEAEEEELEGGRRKKIKKDLKRFS